ncbi:hypothetical protein [Ornithinimicrobium sp. LYQ103]
MRAREQVFRPPSRVDGVTMARRRQEQWVRRVRWLGPVLGGAG